MPENVKLPALGQSASAGAIGQRTSPTESAGHAAALDDLRPSSAHHSPPSSPKSNHVLVKFRGTHGITCDGTRVTRSVMQSWMLGVRPGWTVLSVAGQAVQTKEDIDEYLLKNVEGEKRYEVCFLKGQGKFGTEAKEKAMKEKRQQEKLRREFRFQTRIDRTEHRSTTYAQMERVLVYLEDNCWGWVDHLPAKLSKTSGKPLRMDFLNFHHLNNYMILPATKSRKCAFAEMLASQPQPPSWYLSHWWGGPVSTFMECVKVHIATRGLTLDTPYWVWAFACKQHMEQCEITQDLRNATFAKALEAAKSNMLLVIDPQAKFFKRIWCAYELSLCLDHPGAPIDMATFQGSNAELLTHGMTDDEEKLELQCPGRGVRAKAAREADFPMDLADAGLAMQIEKAEASREEDRALILAGVGALGQLTEQRRSLLTEEDQVACEEINTRLRALFAAAFWTRASTNKEVQDISRLAKAATALQNDETRKSLDMRLEGVNVDSFRLLAESLPPNLQELKLWLRCAGVDNEGMGVLGKTLPKEMKELRLDLTRCENLDDTGVQALAKCLNFDESAVYIKLGETKVSKDVQDWYTAEIVKNEETGQNGQLKNVSRALGVNLCVGAENIRGLKKKAVSVVNELGKVIAKDEETRALAALRALNSFGEKARQALGEEASQRAAELEHAILQAKLDRKAKEADRKAKEEAKNKAKEEAAQG